MNMKFIIPYFGASSCQNLIIREEINSFHIEGWKNVSNRFKQNLCSIFVARYSCEKRTQVSQPALIQVGKHYRGDHEKAELFARSLLCTFKAIVEEIWDEK
jgi:hypothetical protein